MDTPESSLPEHAAHRLLARAVELDHARAARVPVAHLREAAREVGVSYGAFAQALAEARAADAAPAATSAAPPRRGAFRLLADPFARLGPGGAAALAAAAVLLGLVAARAGVRFDGALNLHLAGAPVPVGTALADQAAALLAPALVGWAAVRALGGRATLGRLVAALGVAQLPLVLASPLALAAARLLPPEALAGGAVPVTPSPAFLGAGLALAALFVWAVALAVAGVRWAGGVRGRRLAAATVIALLGGGLVGKLALAWIAARG